MITTSTIKLEGIINNYQVITNFLNSNFFQSIIPIFVVIFGLRYFFIQQKAIRLQNLYYDDSLKKHVNILNENISTVSKNHIHIGGFLDYIDNFRNIKDREYLLYLLREELDMIKPTIPLGLTEGALNFLFTDASAHLMQWISKSQKDFDFLYQCTKGQLLVLYKKVFNGDIPDNNKLQQIAEQLECKYISAERHYVLKNLFDVLIINFAEFDFKRNENLKKMIQRQSIKEYLQKIDTCFKMLFGFYQNADEKDTWYSYAQREDNKCFRIKFSKVNNEISVMCAKISDFPSQFINLKPTMVLFDEVLGGVKIGDDILIRILIDLVYTKIGFKKPDILVSRPYFL